ncbi:methylmalonyl-CoA mutase family protein [Streptomyces sp. NPDC003717]|uniref:methylmalonyl-CoA mutase family protein n=1 Tax=Streptomyces sp. NPDC003717 TaxID=3154276 RepID=UPI0033AEE4D6
MANGSTCTGFGTAVEGNARYKQLIAAGTTGLSVAFDLPTRLGHDSDAPVACGEVGRAGVAVDSLDDMRVLFGGIPLDRISTSMAVDAPAALLLLMYQLVGEEQGVAADRLTGTIRNDVLKEYLARGTCIFPPGPALRLIADVFAYCAAEIPRWNTISISGHPTTGAGASPAQEIAFTLADGIEYVRTAVAAGMDVDDLAPRLSFCFVARTTLLEEEAVHRAARRIWSGVMREEFGARDPKSLALRARRPLSAPSPGPAPFAVERTTDDVAAGARELMDRIEELGGAVKAIERGFQKSEIERSARRFTQQTDSGLRVVAEGEVPYEPFRVGPVIEARQAERLAKLRAWRCDDRVAASLGQLRKAAEGDDNVLYPMKDALAAGATIGEVCDTLRGVWGAYLPGDAC